MGDRESHQSSTESRRDLAARPPTRRGREDALLRFLGAAAYEQTKSAEPEQPEETAKPTGDS